MRKPPFDNEARACEKGDFNPSNRFLGTTNKRHLRALAVLLERPLFREELDKIAGCSNGPELVAELRRRGLKIPCDLVTRMDKDGKPCRPGVYSLTDDDRLKLANWRAGQ
jgi:hypothetical protein